MGIPSAGDVVVLPFPFSDLSESKVRPAVVLACPTKAIGFCAKLPAIPTEMHRQLSSLRLISNRECCDFRVMRVRPNCLLQTKV